jgi:hypothetical protein
MTAFEIEKESDINQAPASTDSFDNISNGSISKLADKLQKLDINACKKHFLGLQSNFAQTIFDFQENESIG